VGEWEGAMEDMGPINPDPAFWSSKAVFITGHTGFKGGWLASLLSSLGANVHGYALAPETGPSFYELTHLSRGISSSCIADIRDLDKLESALAEANPEVIFHLAAQPLVRRSYRDPIQTYETNVLGTVKLLQAARACARLRAIVVVTTDKCYENHGWPWGYRETDSLGGHDPYSNSKACQELVVGAFRASYFQELKISVATARAGNVIGGGDWSEDRLVPDAIRAHLNQSTLKIRSPKALRPWQHVLEPVSAYLLLAERLYFSSEFATSWNFGPAERDVVSVERVLEMLSANLQGGFSWETEKPSQLLHEADVLKLDCSKARTFLGWEPRWGLESAVVRTCEWYSRVSSGEDAVQVTGSQFKDFLSGSFQ